ncbi:DUF6268 family outer membrane beta-barrel protein [Aureivirga marina]|uniref:DUF6268 family outer membrane beta-barrel protein n=1 Tax=Aureivirga marina TaxID=1182451 RepID=UPI0018CBBC2A|nr:DUF6268 family outer membrane beta-barrel protein [Aureivirga marina]
MKVRLFFLGLFFVCLHSKAQDREFFRFSYKLNPMGDVEMNETSVRFTIPTKISEDKFLFHTIGGSYYDFSYHDTFYFQTENLENIYSFHYTLAYNQKVSENWRMHMYARIALNSNLEGSLSTSDFFPTGGMVFNKRKGGKTNFSNLSLGVAYTTRLGKPRVIPVIKYYKQINAFMAYNIGLAETFFKYSFDQRKSLKFGIQLNGFNANISNSLYVDGKQASNIVFSTGNLGLEYNYKLSESWSIFGRGGYSLWNTYALEDDDYNKVYEFDTTTNWFFSTGIKFNFSK